MSSVNVEEYLDALKEQFVTGHAREHAYRPALERLMARFDNVTAVNDPKRSLYGNPDFVFVKKNNTDITYGYAEAKDIDADLSKVATTEQLRRYAGYDKLFLTNYIDFWFYRNGTLYEQVSIAALKNSELIVDSSEFGRLHDVLFDFVNQKPAAVKSGKQLSVIMGGRARRIRDNVLVYLKHQDTDKNKELEGVFAMMKHLLVHDLTIDKFADMYAQTLVYGLFAARYSDNTPETFSRSEARDLVPASNPFLRAFFDHIAGINFDARLKIIVDELCEVFQVSNVHRLVQKHLRLFEVDNEKDPIIHFYEDFLKEYDPAIRKSMGAYYTPLPVVRFIIREVDRILKEDFDLPKGLADTTKRTIAIDNGQGKKVPKEVHKVQILDPAVGTATFLNETIKFVHKSFEGQEGKWPAYAKSDLLPRLHGFELMMAPYTIAHLKLGMTLLDTGVTDFGQRLGVYLTNTLEEGIQRQQDLLSYGLASVVSHEAEEAAKIKYEQPIMVVMGNPPYSVSSNNKSEFIESLLKDFKQGVTTTTNTQPLSDDYLKFIKFAQHLIDKNGNGIVAYICNRSFIEGIVHHKVRESLSLSFDDIYIYDLNGDNTINQAAGDTTDKNVFDIKQGTCICIFVKHQDRKSVKSSVRYWSIKSSRKEKFDRLTMGNMGDVAHLTLDNKYYFFINKHFVEAEYETWLKLDDIFSVHSSAIATSDDSNLVKPFAQEGNWHRFYYRPFDVQYVNYDLRLVKGNRYDKLTRHLLNKDLSVFYDNIILTCSKNVTTPNFSSVLISDGLTERKYSDYSRGPHLFPAYIYDQNGIKSDNFMPSVQKKLSTNLSNTASMDQIIDYIYAILYSPSYRNKFEEYLKIDFPRIPAPKNDKEFTDLNKLGATLRELHLMSEPNLESLVTTFSQVGSDVVEKVNYIDDRVYINDVQYFGNVPEVAWSFYIGGYQPAQKWLKDRKGNVLTTEDIDHYQKIIKVLVETEKTMKQIDKVWKV